MKRNKRKSLLEPLRQNVVKRLSNTDARARRKLLLGLIIFIGLFLLYSFFSGTYGFVRIAKLHVQKHRLAEQNHYLLVRLVDAELTAKRLRNDMTYIEYIARTKHFFSKPGEVIYRFKQ
ncbi:MAG: septum formation initiator family protein [Candidatus Zixiibacteriota bacterium]|nr:MAG: septum formation initiator family protein [candidate division Zixibacteria bacterium]